eukprot:evm.model.NODE_18643_length_16345_cov_22.311655.3
MPLFHTIQRARLQSQTYLEEGLLVEDGAGDVVSDVRGGEEEATVRLAVRLRVLHTDPFQTLADGLGRLVHGQDTLACGMNGKEKKDE